MITILYLFLCVFSYSDILHKLNRNVLNMKYDIKTLIEKNEKLEELILNMNTGYNNNNLIGNLTNVSFEDDFLGYINKIVPLKTNEDLLEFESKLMDNVFRSKVVNIKYIIIHKYLFFDAFIETIPNKIYRDHLLN